MDNLFAQTNSTKLLEKDFERVLDFYEKFSESVIFQDTEERKIKLYDKFTKILKLKIPENSRKRAIESEKGEAAKKRKLNQIKIPQVPDEIWLKIMNFMGSQTIFANFALVCKKFHRLTLDSGAVKGIKLCNIKSSEKYKNAMKVLKRSKNVDRVQIEYSSTYCSNFITQAFKSNPKLKSLIVNSECRKVEEEDWFKFTKSIKKVFGKHLEKMALGAIDLNDSQDDIMKEILCQKNLKTLHLSQIYDTNIVINFLNLLPKNCKKLSDVNFSYIICNDVNRIQLAFDNFFEEAKENLKILKCPRVYHDDGIVFIPNSRWEIILKNLSLCQNLEVLEILDASFISNATFPIISKLPNLKRLTLKALQNVGNELDTLFQNMNLEKLEYLHIQGLYHLSLEALSNRKPSNLKEIWISTGMNLKLQESTLNNLKNCPKLKKIGLKWSNLDAISTYQLQEFNKNIALFIIQTHYDDQWIKFENLVLEFTFHRKIAKID